MTAPDQGSAHSSAEGRESNPESCDGDKASPQRPNRALGGGAIGRLLRRATTVSFFTALGVGVGFLVDVLLVARFGIGASTDAFSAAIPYHWLLLPASSPSSRCWLPSWPAIGGTRPPSASC